MHKARELPQDIVEIIVSEYKKGHSVEKVSRMAGVGTHIVNRVLKENNIEIRPRGTNNHGIPKEHRQVTVKEIPDDYTGAIDCDTQGHKCIYRSRTPNLNLCDYCAINGHSRGGNPHECTKYKIKERRKA